MKQHDDVRASTATVLPTHLMPCERRQNRRFLFLFPASAMRRRFSPELVPLLPHSMRKVFIKSEDDSQPLSPHTPIASSLSLIPKPPGEVGHVKRGGYTLRNVLEKQHGWENGLYDKIRV